MVAITTTVVVSTSWRPGQVTFFSSLLTSLFFGLYLFVLDYGVNSLVQLIFRRFGAA